MINPKLFVKIHHDYGRDYLHADCRSSHLLLKFAGKKFFDANMIAILQQLNFKFEAR